MFRHRQESDDSDESSDFDSWSYTTGDDVESVSYTEGGVVESVKEPFSFFGFNLFESEETFQVDHKIPFSKHFKNYEANTDTTQRGVFELLWPMTDSCETDDRNTEVVKQQYRAHSQTKKEQSDLRTERKNNRTNETRNANELCLESEMHDESIGKTCTGNLKVPKLGFWKPEFKNHFGNGISCNSRQSSSEKNWDKRHQIDDKLILNLQSNEKREKSSEGIKRPENFLTKNQSEKQSRTVTFAQPKNVRFVDKVVTQVKNKYVKTTQLVPGSDCKERDVRDDDEGNRWRFEVPKIREASRVEHRMNESNSCDDVIVNFKPKGISNGDDGISDKRCFPTWPFNKKSCSSETINEAIDSPNTSPINMSIVDDSNESRDPAISYKPNKSGGKWKKPATNDSNQFHSKRNSSKAIQKYTKQIEQPYLNFPESVYKNRYDMDFDIWDEASETTGWFSLGSLDAR